MTAQHTMRERARSLSMAAVGAAADAVKAAGEKLDEWKHDLEPMVDRSAVEGRRAIGRIPGSARVLGAADETELTIGKMPGVDRPMATTLRRAGVHTIDDLWVMAGDATGRRDLAGRTGIDQDVLATLAKRADLMQVSSIGPRYATLLELAGVSSLKELRRRNPESLLAALEAANATHVVVERLPGVERIREWIERADLVAA